MRKLEVYSRLRKMRRRVVTRKGGRARRGVLRNSAGSRASWKPRLHLLCGLGWLTLLSCFLLHKQAAQLAGVLFRKAPGKSRAR